MRANRHHRFLDVVGVKLAKRAQQSFNKANMKIYRFELQKYQRTQTIMIQNKTSFTFSASLCLGFFSSCLFTLFWLRHQNYPEILQKESKQETRERNFIFA